MRKLVIGVHLAVTAVVVTALCGMIIADATKRAEK